MAEDATPTVETDETQATTGGDEAAADEQRVPYDRFQQANKKAKEAAQRATDLERQMAELKASMEQRDAANLPELERERKAREQIEKRLEDAERRAAESEARVARTQREQWVAQAAAAQNFANPARAARLIDDLDAIEDPDQAERAVKRLARSDSYLLKADDTQPKIGRVLQDGKQVPAGKKQAGRIDPNEEASMIASELSRFVSNWRTAE